MPTPVAMRLPGSALSSAANYNETNQYQSNPTVVSGDHIGSVDVNNEQSNYTSQQANAHPGGYEAPWFGSSSSAANYNETNQYQNNPTLVLGGDHVGSVDVHNDQSNGTFQQADAGSGGHGLPGFLGGASNFNITTQVQADPTIVIGDHVGSVDVHNSQTNGTEQSRRLFTTDHDGLERHRLRACGAPFPAHRRQGPTALWGLVRFAATGLGRNESVIKQEGRSRKSRMGRPSQRGTHGRQCPGRRGPASRRQPRPRRLIFRGIGSLIEGSFLSERDPLMRGHHNASGFDRRRLFLETIAKMQRLGPAQGKSIKQICRN